MKEPGDHSGQACGEHQQRHVEIPPEHAWRIVQAARNLKRCVGHRRIAQMTAVMMLSMMVGT
jgi:hypothetical protein